MELQYVSEMEEVIAFNSASESSSKAILVLNLENHCIKFLAVKPQFPLAVFPGKRWGFLLSSKQTNAEGLSLIPLLVITNKTAKQFNILTLFLYVILKFEILFTPFHSLSISFQKWGITLSQILPLLQMLQTKQARYGQVLPTRIYPRKQSLNEGVTESPAPAAAPPAML